MTTTWKIDNFTLILHESEGKLSVDMVDKNTKQAWESQEITEKIAATIVEGLFDEPLATLSEMIKDACNRQADVTYTISIKVC
jgi:hypothetical protein